MFAVKELHQDRHAAQYKAMAAMNGWQVAATAAKKLCEGLRAPAIDVSSVANFQGTLFRFLEIDPRNGELKGGASKDLRAAEEWGRRSLPRVKALNMEFDRLIKNHLVADPQLFSFRTAEAIACAYQAVTNAWIAMEAFSAAADMLGNIQNLLREGFHSTLRVSFSQPTSFRTFVDRAAVTGPLTLITSELFPLHPFVAQYVGSSSSRDEAVRGIIALAEGNVWSGGGARLLAATKERFVRDNSLSERDRNRLLGAIAEGQSKVFLELSRYFASRPCDVITEPTGPAFRGVQANLAILSNAMDELSFREFGGAKTLLEIANYSLINPADQDALVASIGTLAIKAFEEFLRGNPRLAMFESPKDILCSPLFNPHKLPQLLFSLVTDLEREGTEALVAEVARRVMGHPTADRLLPIFCAIVTWGEQHNSKLSSGFNDGSWEMGRLGRAVGLFSPKQDAASLLKDLRLYGKILSLTELTDGIEGIIALGEEFSPRAVRHIVDLFLAENSNSGLELWDLGLDSCRWDRSVITEDVILNIRRMSELIALVGTSIEP